MPIGNLGRHTFFNYYILFPKDTPNPKTQKSNLVKSVILGIVTFGLIHAACSIVYGVKKLYGRASTHSPDVSGKVNHLVLTGFNPKTPPISKKVKELTPKDIHEMTPDEQGNLMDNYSARKSGRSDLTQEQLKGMIRTENSDTFKIINKQETGLGHCGRYAINNAFQKEALSQEDFLRLTCECFIVELKYSKEDAEALINDNGDFGIDVGVLKYILEKQFEKSIKQSEIYQLPECDVSKQEAMESFIGEAKWAIIANTKDAIFDMPSNSAATYALTKGHFVALSKDEKGEWWYIDSRANDPTNIALAVIPRSCTLIVPIS